MSSHFLATWSSWGPPTCKVWEWDWCKEPWWSWAPHVPWTSFCRLPGKFLKRPVSGIMPEWFINVHNRSPWPLLLCAGTVRPILIPTNPQLRSCSVHKRHIFGPQGDTRNQRVRMSNLLASNMACFLELLSRHRRFWFVVEQPASSYLFKMEFMLALSALLCCKKIHTWNLVLYYVLWVNLQNSQMLWDSQKKGIEISMWGSAMILPFDFKEISLHTPQENQLRPCSLGIPCGTLNTGSLIQSQPIHYAPNMELEI